MRKPRAQQEALSTPKKRSPAPPESMPAFGKYPSRARRERGWRVVNKGEKREAKSGGVEGAPLVK